MATGFTKRSSNMKYIDASFFIMFYFDITEKGINARKFAQKIISGEETAVTSSLTLDEVMWVIVKNKKKEVLRKVIENIYTIQNLRLQEVGSDIPLAALELIEKENLKPRDAFHVAVMKKLGVGEIVSDDEDFDRVKGIKRVKL